MTDKSYKVPVQKRNLITLPKDVREKLDIYEGDMLDVRVDGAKIIIEPYKLVPASQAYFWSKKTQKDMAEAEEDVKAGRIREFSNPDGFSKGLQDD